MHKKVFGLVMLKSHYVKMINLTDNTASGKPDTACKLYFRNYIIKKIHFMHK